VTEQDREKKTKIVGEIKLSCSIEHLCLGMPAEFLDYFTHLRSLSNTTKPNYKYLIEIL